MTSQNEDVIDLTNSFTLVDHQNMKGVIIDLESDSQTDHSTSTRRQSKRRAKSCAIPPKTTPSTRLTVYDLCTPDNKVKKKTETSAVAQERTRSTPKNENQNSDMDMKHCCPICYDEFGTNPLASTKCGHVFCFKCITLALKNESKCPTCRRKLKGTAAVHPIFL